MQCIPTCTQSAEKKEPPPSFPPPAGCAPARRAAPPPAPACAPPPAPPAPATAGRPGCGGEGRAGRQAGLLRGWTQAAARCWRLARLLTHLRRGCKRQQRPPCNEASARVTQATCCGTSAKQGANRPQQARDSPRAHLNLLHVDLRHPNSLFRFVRRRHLRRLLARQRRVGLKAALHRAGVEVHRFGLEEGGRGCLSEVGQVGCIASLISQHACLKNPS